MPRIGGGGSTLTFASGTSAKQRLVNSAAIRVTYNSGSARLLKSSRIRMSWPKFEPDAPTPKALPEMAIVCLTPFRPIAIRCAWSTAARVRSIDAASGNCTVANR